VESPQGRKPLGTRRQKSELVSSFCRLASPRLATADLAQVSHQKKFFINFSMNLRCFKNAIS
jgi:hypothetical protein